MFAKLFLFSQFYSITVICLKICINNASYNLYFTGCSHTSYVFSGCSIKIQIDQLSIKWVGILIINALLILPAASSRNISENLREYHFFSILYSVFSGIVGLFISYYTNVATGPMIVIIASVIFFATYFYGRNR